MTEEQKMQQLTYEYVDGMRQSFVNSTNEYLKESDAFEQMNLMKDQMQKGYIMDGIKKMAFRNESITISNVNPKEYQGACIRACYNVAWARYENVDDWYKYCLEPYCQVRQGEVIVDYNSTQDASR